MFYPMPGLIPRRSTNHLALTDRNDVAFADSFYENIAGIHLSGN
jgi:hypothetical protein